jgi:hypothetical protein
MEVIIDYNKCYIGTSFSTEFVLKFAEFHPGSVALQPEV